MAGMRDAGWGSGGGEGKGVQRAHQNPFTFRGGHYTYAEHIFSDEVVRSLRRLRGETLAHACSLVKRHTQVIAAPE